MYTTRARSGGLHARPGPPCRRSRGRGRRVRRRGSGRVGGPRAGLWPGGRSTRPAGPSRRRRARSPRPPTPGPCCPCARSC
ncbi:MAG: hypothetical protein C4342_02035 [Armatimonadota bacterium]